MGQLYSYVFPQASPSEVAYQMATASTDTARDPKANESKVKCPYLNVVTMPDRPPIPQFRQTERFAIGSFDLCELTVHSGGLLLKFIKIFIYDMEEPKVDWNDEDLKNPALRPLELIEEVDDPQIDDSPTPPPVPTTSNQPPADDPTKEKRKKKKPTCCPFIRRREQLKRDAKTAATKKDKKSAGKSASSPSSSSTSSSSSKNDTRAESAEPPSRCPRRRTKKAKRRPSEDQPPVKTLAQVQQMVACRAMAKFHQAQMHHHYQSLLVNAY